MQPSGNLYIYYALLLFLPYPTMSRTSGDYNNCCFLILCIPVYILKEVCLLISQRRFCNTYMQTLVKHQLPQAHFDNLCEVVQVF